MEGFRHRGGLLSSYKFHKALWKMAYEISVSCVVFEALKSTAKDENYSLWNLVCQMKPIDHYFSLLTRPRVRV